MPASSSKVDISELLAHRVWLRALARDLVGNDHDAEDLVQRTWLAVLRAPAMIERPRAWLATVARRLAWLQHRRAERAKRHEAAAVHASDPASVTESLHRFGLQGELTDAIRSMHRSRQEVIVMRYFENLPPREIGKRLGLTAGAVRTRLSRALRELRDRLDEKFGGERQAWCVPLTAWLLTPPAGVGGAVAGVMAVRCMMTIRHSAGLVLALVGASVIALVAWTQWPTEDPVLVASPGEYVAATSVSEGAPPTPVAELQREPLIAQDEASRATADQVPAELSIRARCVRPDLRPVVGVEVRWVGQQPRLGRSDADGRVEFVCVEPDGVLEFRDADGSVTQRAVRSEVGMAVLELGDLVIAPAGGLTGRVVDVDGAPCVGATVVAVPGMTGDVGQQIRDDAELFGVWTRLAEGREWRAVTDRFGDYELHGVPPTHVSVRANSTNSLFCFSNPVALTQGEVQQVPDILLRTPDPACVIRGQLLDADGQPLPQHDIRATPLARGPVTNRLTDAQGRFGFLVRREASVELSCDASDVHGACAVVAHSGDHEVVMRLRRATWVSVEVICREGVVSNAHVDLLQERAGALLALPTRVEVADGGVRVQVPVRPFRVRVRAEGFGTKVLGPFLPESAPSVLKVNLEPAFGVSGRIVASNEAWPGSRIHAHVAYPEGLVGRSSDGFVAHYQADPIASGEVDSDGQFTINLQRSGQYVLRGTTGQQAIAFGPVAFRGDAQVEVGDVKAMATGGIDGVVRVPSGSVATGMVIGATCGDGNMRTASVDANGRFQFSNLPAGDYQVRRCREEAVRWATSRDWQTGPALHVGAGEQSPITLDLVREMSCPVTIGARLGSTALIGWTATLVHDGARVGGILDAEGRAVLVTPSAGDYSLTIDAPYGSRLRPSIHAKISVGLGQRGAEQSGPATWQLQVDTGTLRAAAPPTAVTIELAWRNRDDTRFALVMDLAAGELLDVPDLPAGQVTVRRRPAGLPRGTDEWPLLATVTIEAGKVKSLPTWFE